MQRSRIRCASLGSRYRRRRTAGRPDAYDAGRVDDDGLVTALEAAEFDTERIAEREDELERVANAYDFEFRPYGGTLMHDEDDEGGNRTDDFEAW